MHATTEGSPDLSHAAAAPVAATAPVAASAEIEPAVGGGEDRTGSDSGTGKYILLSESGGQESIKVSAATVEAADTVPAVGGSMGHNSGGGFFILLNSVSRWRLGKHRTGACGKVERQPAVGSGLLAVGGGLLAVGSGLLAVGSYYYE